MTVDRGFSCQRLPFRFDDVIDCGRTRSIAGYGTLKVLLNLTASTCTGITCCCSMQIVLPLDTCDIISSHTLRKGELGILYPRYQNKGKGRSCQACVLWHHFCLLASVDYGRTGVKARTRNELGSFSGCLGSTRWMD